MNTEIQFARDLSDILAHVRKLNDDGDVCEFKFVQIGTLGGDLWCASIERDNGEIVTAPAGSYDVADSDPVVALRKLAERLYD